MRAAELITRLLINLGKKLDMLSLTALGISNTSSFNYIPHTWHAKKTFSDWWPTPQLRIIRLQPPLAILYSSIQIGSWFFIHSTSQGASIKKAPKNAQNLHTFSLGNFYGRIPMTIIVFMLTPQKLVMGVPPKGWLWPINWWWFNNDRSKLASLMTQGKLKKLKLLSNL